MNHAHHAPASHSAKALTLVSLAHGINHAQSALMSLIYPLTLRAFGAGYGRLGVMLGIASALGGSLQLVAGALGTVVRRPLLLGMGSACVGVFVALVATAQNFAQFFLWIIASRVAGAAQHPVGSSLLAHHFSQRRLGMALATHITAGNLGTALIPMVAAVMISYFGWRVTTFLFAIPIMLVGLTIWLGLDDPRDASQHGTHAVSASFWSHSREAAGNSHLRWILLATLVVAGGSGHGILPVYIPLYLSHDLGLGPAAVGFNFSMLMVGSIVGPLLAGQLLDRFNRQPVALGAYGFGAMLTFIFPWVGTQPLLLPLCAVLLGTATFSASPIIQTIIGSFTEDRTRDISFALFYSAAFMAGALWQPVVGYIGEAYGLKFAFGLMAISFVLASFCLVAARLDKAPSS